MDGILKLRSKSNYIAIFLILQYLWSCTAQSSNNVQRLKHIQTIAFIIPNDTSSLTLAEKNDAASLQKVLNISGFRYSLVPSNVVTRTKLSNYDIIIVPFASTKQLNDADLATIVTAVKSGKSVFTDGVSKLGVQLGISVQAKSIQIRKIIDSHFSKNSLYWTTPAEVYAIDNNAGKDSVLAFDEASHQPIAIYGKRDKGRIVYISTLFDPNTNKGYSRFPFLIEWLEKNVQLTRFVERQSMEMYFDPQMHSDSLNMDSLALLWRERMIKRVFVAGWYYDNAADYESIIKACHKNGIQAFCWLETPEVNRTFWEKHPQWREKTATGRDAHIDWRRLMNLADESCRTQVFKELDSMLMKNDWDGVNLAELYFEPHPEGFDNPQDFTPMNSVVRNDFKQKSGFDPQELFDNKSLNYWKTNKKSWRLFADYRKDLSYKLKGICLEFLNTIKSRKTGFDVMLTGIDVSLQPQESDNIGESTDYTLALYKKYNITLQIEDPSNCWGSGPERYAELGALYRKTVKDENRLVFDCNVVGSHEKGFGGFPSERPSGEEIRQIAFNMATHNVRPIFYAEDGVSLIDFKNISTVLASKAQIIEEKANEWTIKSPYTTWVNTGLNNATFLLDKKPWFAQYNGKVMIPKGNHLLSCDTIHTPIHTIGLQYFSGELLSASFGENTLQFNYSEDLTSCYAILTSKPKSIEIDGKDCKCILFDGKECVLKLPQGKHTIIATMK
jgi:hypothetical protein